MMGQEEDVRPALGRAERRRWPARNASVAADTPVRHLTPTFASDESDARTFVLSFRRRRQTEKIDAVKLNQTLRSLPYSVSETRVTEEGVEKRTRSSFGLFGSIVGRFAPPADTADTQAGAP